MATKEGRHEDADSLLASVLTPEMTANLAKIGKKALTLATVAAAADANLGDWARALERENS